MKKLTQWLGSLWGRFLFWLENNFGEMWRYYTDDGCAMLKWRLYYTRRVFLIRLFRPRLWRLAVDVENYYDDFDPWDQEEKFYYLYEKGLPVNIKGAYYDTAVSLLDWDLDYTERVKQVLDELEETDSMYQRGMDLHQRLEAWELKRTRPKKVYKFRDHGTGKIHKVRLVVTAYQSNGGLCVALCSKSGWYHKITANIGDLDYLCAVIDNLNPAYRYIIHFLKQNHIADLKTFALGRRVYQFNERVLQAHSPRGLEMHKRLVAARRRPASLFHPRQQPQSLAEGP